MGKKKNGAVIGLGEFGIHLSLSLAEDGSDVIAIDSDPKRVEIVKDYVTKPIIADIRQHSVLKSIISPDLDFVFVSLGTIEASTIAILYLKELGIENIYAKANNDEHERILRLMGVKRIVFPEKDMAERVSARLTQNNLVDYIPLSEEYSIAEITPHEFMAKKSLLELDFRNHFNLTIIAIKELTPEGRSYIFPKADTIVKISDQLVVLGTKESLKNYNNSK